MTAHTIILVQKTDRKSTRSFYDFETVSLAVEEIVRMFETRLKELNPSVPKINYNIRDLFNYLDSFNEICALVYEDNVKAYAPHDKEWIKIKIKNYLERASRN